ncbi:hypothetical protein [uncultured Alistipes sp.]|uniref:hypothetical protein n=1 Tax=uncultured Alistipes sp. TaxID=538949 RepID=UPI0032B23F13
MKKAILFLALTAMISCGGDSFVIPAPIGGGTKPGPDPEGPDQEEPAPPVPEDLPGWPLVRQGAGTLVADGDDAGTYALISAQGYNQEAPDTSGDHAKEPFRHIRQVFDQELKRWVFDFLIHVENDDDKGNPQKRDRQRNEIKTDGHSPASMVAQEGETLEMRWKFRLPAGMRTTSKFCHVHQLKGIDNREGTADVSLPLITFSPRTLSNGRQQFQVIHVPPTEEGAGNDYLARIDLTDLLGEWVAVTERVRFAREGSYSLVLTRIADGRELLRLENVSRNLWRTGTAGLRPKWGIYRSIGDDGALKGQLRDEAVRFADFEIEKIAG